VWPHIPADETAKLTADWADWHVRSSRSPQVTTKKIQKKSCFYRSVWYTWKSARIILIVYLV
jgi:hypothetical protein